MQSDAQDKNTRGAPDASTRGVQNHAMQITARFDLDELMAAMVEMVDQQMRQKFPVDQVLGKRVVAGISDEKTIRTKDGRMISPFDARVRDLAAHACQLVLGYDVEST